VADELLTTRQAADLAMRAPATIRKWEERDILAPADYTLEGWPLYDHEDVLQAERVARSRDNTGAAQRAIERHAAGDH
jgi:DNA-binding transcriptional MerR regulator